ncbi:MAG TPA: helical backbone metal receptor [Gemmatimonadota bacterium]|jgi:iron complex transport system substrate-binding protein|nr:helical backbone metal receptor [Gemmatimonadota bacterium]
MHRARTSFVLATIALVSAVSACERAPEEGGDAAGPRVVDDAGDTLALSAPARRIVSLVPSVTGTIVSLGAADRLIARTRYDLDPALAALPSLGGGLDPSIEGIVALRPDLVIAWNARDDRVLVPRLRAAGIPVYVAEIQDTTGVFATLDRVGELLGTEDRADSVAGALRDTFAAVAADVPPGPRPTALYLIAEDPPRSAGPGTFIGQAIEIAGALPAFPEIAEDWPTVALEAVMARNPNVIVLPVGADLPARDVLARRPGWRDLPAVREARIVEIEADLLARPGPDLGRAARVLREGLSAIADGQR